jgi:hypothetical protein
MRVLPNSRSGNHDRRPLYAAPRPPPAANEIIAARLDSAAWREARGEESVPEDLEQPGTIFAARWYTPFRKLDDKDLAVRHFLVY